MKKIGRNVKILITLVGLVDVLEGLALTFFPETLGAMVWPGHVDAFDARLYAAPYLSIAFAAVLVLRENDWARIRLVFPPAIFFTAFMIVVALMGLGTSEGFATGRLATWVFFAAYVSALIGGVAIYWRYERT